MYRLDLIGIVPIKFPAKYFKIDVMKLSMGGENEFVTAQNFHICVIYVLL